MFQLLNGDKIVSPTGQEAPIRLTAAVHMHV